MFDIIPQLKSSQHLGCELPKEESKRLDREYKK